MKKINKKQQGFTLVEVIVVAVIVAVLAAVAIPLYMGYIKDSRINVGDNIAGTIASAAGASTQQGVVFAIQQGPSTKLAPLNIRFASVNDAAVNNDITVPPDFTVVWVDAQPGLPGGGPATVTCHYTTYLPATAKTITYKQ